MHGSQLSIGNSQLFANYGQILDTEFLQNHGDRHDWSRASFQKKKREREILMKFENRTKLRFPIFWRKSSQFSHRSPHYP